MNKQLKTSLLIASILSSMSGVSFAQQSAKPTINAPETITHGNGFEKEMTPLLREISRKKSQLELRKLDRDLERLDEESLKAQMSMESTLNGGANGQQKPAAGYDPFSAQKAMGLNSAPAGLPGPSAMPVNTTGAGTATNPLEGASDIKVLMIYGFDDNLYAKILSGDQGGYAVKKGDVLPNGQVVHNVTANYIEVKKTAGTTKGPIQRIFVSQSVASTTSDGSPAKISLGRGDSARPQTPNEAAVANMLAPTASPGARR